MSDTTAYKCPICETVWRHAADAALLRGTCHTPAEAAKAAAAPVAGGSA